MQLALQLLPLPGQLGALSRVGEVMGMMQPLRVGLASLIFSGRVRVALKPLMNKLPIVAAMQARITGFYFFFFFFLCAAAGRQWQARTIAMDSAWYMLQVAVRQWLRS